METRQGFGQKGAAQGLWDGKMIGEGRLNNNAQENSGGLMWFRTNAKDSLYQYLVPWTWCAKLFECDYSRHLK